MLDKEIAALDEFFKAPWVRQEAVFPYWDRIKKGLVEVQKPAHNSDYTAALEVELKQWINSQPSVIAEKDMRELATRLNSAVKAQQNCA